MTDDILSASQVEETHMKVEGEGEIPDALRAALTKLRVDPILLAVSGSRAYGLAHARSDVDLRGVFVAPDAVFLGMDLPPQHPVSLSEPDVVVYELGTFFRLAAACNPNVLEVLFLDEYAILSPVGRRLVASRELFLSQLARRTYAGFALSQLKEFRAHMAREDAGDESVVRRRKKHVRHTFRVLEQGLEVISSGRLSVKVDDPARLFALEDLPASRVEELFAEGLEKIDSAVSPLPEKPDRARLNELLLQLRSAQRDPE